MSAEAGSSATRIVVPAGTQANTSASQGCVEGVAYTLTICVLISGVIVGAHEATNNIKMKFKKSVARILTNFGL